MSRRMAATVCGRGTCAVWKNGWEHTDPVRHWGRTPVPVSSVDLGFSFLKWYLWDNNDNTYLSQHLPRP